MNQYKSPALEPGLAQAIVLAAKEAARAAVEAATAAQDDPRGAVNDKFLTTEQAARMLKRKPQTLRNWQCKGRGPVRAVNVNGRLLWPAEAIQAQLSGALA